MKNYYLKFKLSIVLVAILGLFATTAKAQLLIDEGFATVPPAGWARQNLSNPIGTGVGSTWQGGIADYPAFDGTATQFAFVGFRSTTGNNTISNWFFTPEVALANGNVISFYTRTFTGSTDPDRLELRMSTNGASVNAGAANASVGDFTTLLLTVNPTLTTTGYPENWTRFTATITGLAGPTTGRFAFRYFVTNGGPTGANSNGIGLDRVQYGSACTGTPAPGNTISSVASVCPTIPFNLSLQNAATGLGVTYLWQSASTVGGTYTNIVGAINPTLTTSLTATTFYRAIVTCGAASGTSTPVQVTALPCYCTAGATSTAFEKIGRVQFGTINNTTTSTAGYEDFTSQTTDIFQGATMPITVTLAGGFATDRVMVWIDYNKNLVFTDPGELVYTSPDGAGPHTGNIVIPATAPLGNTRMRVRMYDAGSGTPNATSCGTSTYGQVEDYTVNVVPCVFTSLTTQPVNASVVCGGNATFSATVIGSVPTVFWQFRTTPTGVWFNVPNVAPYSGVNTSTLTITGASQAITGYEYRLVHSGVCNGVNFSNAAILTVTPIIAVVTPASALICNGSIQQLSLTNTVSGDVTTTVNATGLPLNIPDGPFPPTAASVVNIPFTVAGIPAGSVVKNIGVRFNITHPYVGDLVMNLTAPNALKMNIFARLNGGAGNNATSNFTNTTIDSISTTAISGAAAPRSGSYRAEKFGITNPNFGALMTTTTNWASLLTTLNGTWTINLADLGAPDAGSITSISLYITYTAPVFAQGTWNGPAGTIFTDAAGTTAYTGTPATTVFVKPIANGVNNYTVSFVAGSCTSSTVTIPVTVSAPSTAVAAVVSKSVCVGNNTTFTSSVTGGAGIVRTWLVSTDGGATFTPLANGGVYSGVNTDTLRITGATLSMNNYRYRLSVSAAPCASTTTILSTAGTLTVNPTPIVVLNASPARAIFPGQTITLTVAVSPNAGATYTYFRNGVIVLGANGNTLTNINVDRLGSYSVTVTDVNGCVGTSNTVVLRDSASNNLFVYPNPNNGTFEVRYFNDPTSNQNANLARNVIIYDSKGARVYTQRAVILGGTYGPMKVNLTNQPAGVYQIDLVDEKGNRLKTGKVVIL